MRLSRHIFTITGAAALLAAVALAAATFSLQSNHSVQAVGDFTPTPDPCDIQPGSVSGFGQDLVCETPTEETLPKTHTPTPEPSEEPTDVPATEPAATNTSAPPPPVATNTPTGGAGAGGVQPPNTGSNGDRGAEALSWILVIAGLALAAGGTGALGYGLRKN